MSCCETGEEDEAAAESEGVDEWLLDMARTGRDSCGGVANGKHASWVSEERCTKSALAACCNVGVVLREEKARKEAEMEEKVGGRRRRRAHTQRESIDSCAVG